MSATVQSELDRAVSALWALDPNVSRDDWFRILCAFAAAGGDEETAREWSAQSDKFDAANFRATWRDASRPGPVKAGTLFAMAREAGWQPEPGAVVRQIRQPAAPPTPHEYPTTPAMAREYFERCAPAPADHPYLARKRVAPHDCRVNGKGALIVPYLNEAREIQTVQAITTEAKKFLKGARYAGAVAVIGADPNARTVCIAEGYATGASIHAATGFPVVVAGSIGQFPNATRIAREWNPAARLVVCADIGDMAKPFESSTRYGAAVCTPGPADARKGYDFNDWLNDGASPAEILARITSAAPVDASGSPPIDAGAPAEPDAATEALASVTRLPVKRKPKPNHPLASEADFVTANGKVVPNQRNVAALIATGQLGEARFDTFTGEVLWNGKVFDDASGRALTHAVQSYYADGEFCFAKASPGVVWDAMMHVAFANKYNSAAEWLAMIPEWDGVERCAQFFPDVCGTPDDEYTRAVGVYFWASMAARMLEPGARADMAVVLTGREGLGKTSMLRAIGGERYTTASFYKIGEPDWCMNLRGMILVEFDEMAGHSRAEMEAIKGAITRTFDKYREPYARKMDMHPRTNVFAATTNESHFLTESNGNRRWLPIKCDAPIAVDIVQAMREQYFAEAADIVRRGVPYWAIPNAAEVQADRVASDPWAERLPPKLDDVATGRPRVTVDVAWLLSEGLGIPTERQTVAVAKRAATVMARLGYARARWKESGGRQVRGFVLLDSEAGRNSREYPDGSLYVPENYRELF